MNNTDLKSLEEKARAAKNAQDTPGANDSGKMLVISVYMESFFMIANPTAILSLINRLREAESIVSACDRAEVGLYEITKAHEYFDKWGRG